jgi:hypothetical protein
VIEVKFSFIAPGSSVRPQKGMVYVDVGNDFVAGVLDHHHPDAPNFCATRLALDYPEFIQSQVLSGKPLTIVTHLQPDLDAIGAVWIAMCHLHAKRLAKPEQLIADYICAVDRGYTDLNPDQPLSFYAIFVMKISRENSACRSSQGKSLLALNAGLDLLNTCRKQLNSSYDLEDPEWILSLQGVESEVRCIHADLALYQNDIRSVETFDCCLPRKEGKGAETVPGLWITEPSSSLFKSWARGDAKYSGGEGFVFTAIQYSPRRTVISVSPESNVFLKGLGDLLENAETEKRRTLNLVRQGKNRRGYDSPDPWYDGRSPLHGYTIIDSPREGSILSREEIFNNINHFISENLTVA